MHGGEQRRRPGEIISQKICTLKCPRPPHGCPKLKYLVTVGCTSAKHHVLSADSVSRSKCELSASFRHGTPRLLYRSPQCSPRQLDVDGGCATAGRKGLCSRTLAADGTMYCVTNQSVYQVMRGILARSLVLSSAQGSLGEKFPVIHTYNVDTTRIQPRGDSCTVLFVFMHVSHEIQNSRSARRKHGVREGKGNGIIRRWVVRGAAETSGVKVHPFRAMVSGFCSSSKDNVSVSCPCRPPCSELHFGISATTSPVLYFLFFFGGQLHLR